MQQGSAHRYLRHPLTTALARYRSKIRKTQAQIARDSWLDDSYVSRLFKGERTHPSRDALILLAAFGLDLKLEEVDDVLMAAEYRPLVVASLLK